MAFHHTIEDGVATLTLDHPPLNILTRAVLAELRLSLGALADEPNVRVLLVCAAGKHFSAGADVAEHLPPEYAELIPEFMDTIEQLAAFPAPVVAAVRGRCLGGGFELALAADVIVAGEGASFGQPEIMLGVIAPAACVLLPRLATPGFAAEILFTGDAVPAARALAAGVVGRVVADEAVETEALALARRIARHSGAALRMTKRAMLESAGMPRADALRTAGVTYVEDVMRTHDALEGLTAFTQKRAAVWRNR